LSDKFNDRLDRIKRENAPPGAGWYPYDTLGVFDVLDAMLREERRDLLSLVDGSPVLDIGCGDGALSFFLESLGCLVTAVENPSTNFNRTLGFQSLRSLLGSSAELQFQNLDAGFDLGSRIYGLAFCLGVLYHLRNPFTLLETLARHARYCVLSTRIAQVTMRGTPIVQEPVAYLVGAAETNADATNYWIFSEAGLHRIFDRTGWDVCDFTTTGAQRNADPARPDRDQRAFCLLRSKVASPWIEAALEDGWHGMEAGAWRWTRRVFSLNLRRTGPAPTLNFHFILPEAIFRALGPVRLQATVNGVCLPERDYNSAGDQHYVEPIPPAALTGDRVSIRFELDKAFASPDDRELGVQVAFWSYDEPVPKALAPITVG
jgi:2-polyprenyl-3-methyl-5-hydroxy-6-metoxy-1,4-benzoquinol methylase